MKHFEYMFLRGLRNADAIIFDPYANAPIPPLRPHAHLGPRPRMHKFHGIAQEVGKALSQSCLIATDRRQKVSELMTHEGLVTVRENVSQDEALAGMHMQQYLSDVAEGR